jgi:hypothetical protein
MTRDEYVAQLKAQLDRWNTEVAEWEVKAKTAREGMRAEYERQIAAFREQRDRGLDQLKAVQGSSGEVWKDMARGADEAWDRMREAFDRAFTRLGK